MNKILSNIFMCLGCVIFAITSGIAIYFPILIIQEGWNHFPNGSEDRIGSLFFGGVCFFFLSISCFILSDRAAALDK